MPNNIDLNSLNTMITTCTQAEYEEMKARGEISDGKMYCFTTEGTAYSFNYNDYENDNVKVTRITDISSIYEALYQSLVKNNLEKRLEWDTLLKINKNDYRLTVLQIENNNLMEANKKDVI